MGAGIDLPVSLRHKMFVYESPWVRLDPLGKGVQALDVYNIRAVPPALQRRNKYRDIDPYEQQKRNCSQKSDRYRLCSSAQTTSSAFLVVSAAWEIVRNAEAYSIWSRVIYVVTLF